MIDDYGKLLNKIQSRRAEIIILCPICDPA